MEESWRTINYYEVFTIKNMRKNIIIILLTLIVLLIILISYSIFDQINKQKLEVISINPPANSQVLASKKKLEIEVQFSGRITRLLNNLEIKDSFGLKWNKEVKDNQTILYSTSFGNEIMSVDTLEMSLNLGKKILKAWIYQVPFDENVVSGNLEIELEDGASFIPTEEDAEYFEKENERIRQEQPLWELLPYETESFKISHYIDKLKLVVYLKDGADKDLVTEEVNNWIKENGGNPDTHTIEWR